MASLRPFLTILIGFLGLWLISAAPLEAASTTAKQAQQVVVNWLSMSGQPLGMTLGQQVKEVQIFSDAGGNPLYYVVFLEPTGMVFISGDDQVEPILGFASGGVYDPTPTNPLGALLSRDAAGRIAQARELQAQSQLRTLELESARGSSLAEANRKWTWLDAQVGLESGLSGATTSRLDNITDCLVDPIVQSKWGQGNQVGAALYNYYTPNHYLCGCTATAMAQVMRALRWPLVGIGKLSQNYTVDGASQSGFTRGGDGNGGPYPWDLMVYDPITGINDAQRQAIGALCYDVGITINSSYTSDGTGSNLYKAHDALLKIFKYANARYTDYWDSSIPSFDLYNMINPNLDARLPVILGIKGGTGADADHVLVSDGYGYNLATMYHHLCIGEEGMGDAWYNLPLIDSPSNIWPIVDGVLYNIFKTATGTIISGRVTTASGAPLAGAVVTAGSQTDSVGTTTNAHGIYAFVGIPASTTYTVTASLGGYSFQPQTVTTGSAYSFTSGNLWGVNFRDRIPITWKPKYQLFNLSATGTSSRAYAINNDGAIVGAKKAVTGYFNATLWWVVDTGGKQVNYFDLVGLGGTESEAHGVNNKGLVVGWAKKSGSNNKYAVYWNKDVELGQAQLLNTYNGNSGQALGINNLGKIVGKSWFYPPDGSLWAVFWPNTIAQGVGLTSGTGSPAAYRITDWDVSVGVINDRAARWDGTTYTNLDPHGVYTSEAVGIANLKFPVGYHSDASGNDKACIFNGPGQFTDLGSLCPGGESQAYSIKAVNQIDTIVGWAAASDGYSRAMVWDSKNGMQDLNSLVDEPDWVLRSAVDINEKGEIVGWGYYKGIYDFAFLLRPVTRSSSLSFLQLLLGD